MPCMAPASDSLVDWLHHQIGHLAQNAVRAMGGTCNSASECLHYNVQAPQALCRSEMAGLAIQIVAVVIRLVPRTSDVATW